MTFDLKTVIAGAFALIAATAAATWAVRLDRLGQLERTVDAYEKSKEWDLPTTLNSIHEASEKLRVQLSELQKIELLKKQNVDLQGGLVRSEKETARLRIDLKETQENLEKRETYIKNLFPTDELFEIKEGESNAIAGYQVVIGLVNVSLYEVVVNINNKRMKFAAGQYEEFNVKEKYCQLMLTGIKYSTATFRFMCTVKN